MNDAQASSSAQFGPLSGLEGALDWWREAGVDCDFADAPSEWLATEIVEQTPPAATPKPDAPPASSPLDRALEGEPKPPIGGRATWPHDLEGFRQFWMTEPSLDEGGSADRVPPRGPQGAPLMVLVGYPDEGDRETLLSGAQGEVLNNFLRAAGMAADAVYVASVLPRRTALPDWEAVATRGFGGLTQHHVKLAAPQRVLVFGRALQSLLGDADGVPPRLAGPSLESLARSAGRRKRFWINWLDWTA